MSQSELACTYAALILHDDGVEVTVSRPTIPISAFRPVRPLPPRPRGGRGDRSPGLLSQALRNYFLGPCGCVGSV